MEEEFIFNSGDFTECYDENTKVITNTFDVNLDACILNSTETNNERKEIEMLELLPKDVIKTEDVLLTGENFNVSINENEVIKNIKENREFIENCGVKTEKEERLEITKGVVFRTDGYRECGVVLAKGENQLLQQVKDEEETTAQYITLNERDQFKQEIFEGKL